MQLDDHGRIFKKHLSKLSYQHMEWLINSKKKSEENVITVN